MVIELLTSVVMQKELLSGVFDLNSSSEGGRILSGFAIVLFT